MKKLIFILLVASFCGYGQNDSLQKLVLEGHYQGVNIYIQNPFSSSGNSFCVKKVTMNDSTINVTLNASAFEIKLSELNLETGDSVRIEILHQTDCLPKAIYNPPPKQHVEFLNIEVVD
ncbi:hypothetical protein [Parvicella tangerina]|uniref:Uncharacterized protein n=1 Tax=Parvicella tangerina TaxID=2829795 RepID=A0A916JPU8_9FLAO|nr:hypothetical protein [Parvicella tangerina]CAG5086632.1 hypothetical protein CRYO30217_03212 [Parvicella tangerina]